jgi:hypothetical protein
VPLLAIFLGKDAGPQSFENFKKAVINIFFYLTGTLQICTII